MTTPGIASAALRTWISASAACLRPAIAAGSFTLPRGAGPTSTKSPRAIGRRSCANPSCSSLASASGALASAASNSPRSSPWSSGSAGVLTSFRATPVSRPKPCCNAFAKPESNSAVSTPSRNGSARDRRCCASAAAAGSSAPSGPCRRCRREITSDYCRRHGGLPSRDTCPKRASECAHEPIRKLHDPPNPGGYDVVTLKWQSHSGTAQQRFDFTGSSV